MPSNFLKPIVQLLKRSDAADQFTVVAALGENNGIQASNESKDDNKGNSMGSYYTGAPVYADSKCGQGQYGSYLAHQEQMTTGYGFSCTSAAGMNSSGAVFDGSEQSSAYTEHVDGTNPHDDLTELVKMSSDYTKHNIESDGTRFIDHDGVVVTVTVTAVDDETEETSVQHSPTESMSPHGSYAEVDSEDLSNMLSTASDEDGEAHSPFIIPFHSWSTGLLPQNDDHDDLITSDDRSDTFSNTSDSDHELNRPFNLPFHQWGTALLVHDEEPATWSPQQTTFPESPSWSEMRTPSPVLEEYEYYDMSDFTILAVDEEDEEREETVRRPRYKNRLFDPNCELSPTFLSAVERCSPGGLEAFGSPTVDERLWSSGSGSSVSSFGSLLPPIQLVGDVRSSNGWTASDNSLGSAFKEY